MTELTDAQRKAGWTEENLAAYERERDAAQSGVIYFDPEYRRAPRPKWANSSYRIFDWGR